MAKTDDDNLSATKKLSKGLMKNVLATVDLTKVIGNAFKQQGDISKAFISTGNKTAISMDNIRNTFSTVGLSLGQDLKNFQAMQRMGLNLTAKSNKDLFARFTLLGVDTQGLSKIMARNEQTLGFSNQNSIALGNSLIETAVANGFHTDVLVDAMNSLAQTFIRASAVYGKETSKALETATMNLIGKYGAGNAELVKEMSQKLFAGTAESTKMAAMLGLDIRKLATRDAGEAQSLIEQAIKAVGDRVGGAAGAGTSGFAVSKLLESFGATPGMLALANLGPVMGQAAVDSAEALAEQVRQNDLQSSLNQIMRDFTIMLIPVFNNVAKGLSLISSLLTVGNGFVAKLLTISFSIFAVQKVIAFWTKIRAGMIARAIIVATPALWSIGSILSVVGVILGAIFWAVSSSKDTEEDILAENKKQTEAVMGESASTKILGNISLGILQSNVLNEQILLNAQEHLEKTTEMAETPAITSAVGDEWEIKTN